MGTRSFIILPNPKGDYTGIYCHWDGYPKHVGRLLRDHYSKPAAARELIRLGDLSSLGERLRPLNPEAHSFDEAERGTTVAYGRDRGEPSRPARRPRWRRWCRPPPTAGASTSTCSSTACGTCCPSTRRWIASPSTPSTPRCVARQRRPEP